MCPECKRLLRISTDAAADFRKQAEALARYGVSPEDFRSRWQEFERARKRDEAVRAQVYLHLAGDAHTAPAPTEINSVLVRPGLA